MIIKKNFADFSVNNKIANTSVKELKVQLGCELVHHMNTL
jgi:hypothetical protein